MAKTVSSSAILEKKVLFTLNNGHDVCEFLIDYINTKSYGSFKTAVKRLKSLVEELEKEGSLSKHQVKKIHDAIINKEIAKETEVVFNLEDFLNDFKKTFNIRKDDTNDIINLLVLLMPFLLFKYYSDCLNIKFDDVALIEFEQCIILKYKDIEKNKTTTIKISMITNEWKYVFENQKKYSKSEYIFDTLPKVHTSANLQFAKHLNLFTSKNIPRSNYLTSIKNALKDANNPFVSLF